MAVGAVEDLQVQLDAAQVGYVYACICCACSISPPLSTLQDDLFNTMMELVKYQEVCVINAPTQVSVLQLLPPELTVHMTIHVH